MYALVSTIYDNHFVRVFKSEEAAYSFGASFVREMCEDCPSNLNDVDTVEWYEDTLEPAEWFDVSEVIDERKNET